MGVWTIHPEENCPLVSVGLGLALELGLVGAKFLRDNCPRTI